MSKKTIVAEVLPIPNYLFHLIAGSGVLYEGRYSGYDVSIVPFDREYLLSLKSQLGWGAGYSGELAELVVLLPITFGFDKIGQFNEYFDLIKEAKSSGDCSEFNRTYREQLQKINETWVAFDSAEFIRCVPSTETVRRLNGLVQRNWGVYIDAVWPVEEPRMKEYARRINEFCQDRDTIGDWERITGIRFKTERYSILLVSAIENGPNANSAGYDKNVFSTNKPIAWTLDFISHEVGTHLFIDSFRSMADSDRFNYQQLYAANECLAQFMNTIVLGRQELAYDLECFGASKLLPKFRSVYEQIGGFDYEKMVKTVIRRSANDE